MLHPATKAILLTILLISNQTFSDTEFLFTVHGSNTVGAKLAPQCASDYLSSLNVENIQTKSTNITNEFIVSGTRGRGFDLEQVRIKIAAHGSSTGFKALLNQEADLAMSSRPIKQKEILQLAHLGYMKSPKAEHAIAIDGLAILVHPGNPINQLTIEEVAKLFSGEITNWKSLGGYDHPVNLYARDNNSGTWDTFKNLVLAKKYVLSETAQRFESNDKLSDRVSKDVGAIGFTGLASVRKSKLLAVSDNDTQALFPSEYTIATEDYPLSRRLFMYMPENTTSNFVKEFVEHCQSQKGQDIVKQVGFISQNIKQFVQQVGQDAPTEYQELSKKAKRLSVNFRFDQGSPQLDNKAYRDLDRVVSYMTKPENKSLKLYLVGFSDARSQFSHDLLLSKFRALAVHASLMRDGVKVEKSIGLGSFMPVVSNNKEGTKLKNGRVEIWVENSTLAKG